MRLIDADELKKHKYHDKKACENAVAVYYIDTAPSIDIVRCRECKHSGVRNDADVECKRHKLIMRLNDFCSYGSREERSK